MKGERIMPKQYKVLTEQKYTIPIWVEADSEEEAVEKVKNGEGYELDHAGYHKECLVPGEQGEIPVVVEVPENSDGLTLYRVRLSELHYGEYIVYASSKGEAFQKVWDGGGLALGHTDFVDTLDDESVLVVEV